MLQALGQLDRRRPASTEFLLDHATVGESFFETVQYMCYDDGSEVAQGPGYGRWPQSARCAPCAPNVCGLVYTGVAQ